MKAFDITKDPLKVLEVPMKNTDLQKEEYYLSTLQNDEWGYNKALETFVFKVEDQIYYAKMQLVQFRCCGQPPVKLIGCILEKNTLPTGDVETHIVQKDMETMPFSIEDEMELARYCFANLF
ncbi:MAG: hypothetical protein J6F30_13935 [Cellulosilyticum sp.]|nr:hypothetical protein [Cellulosilyticum sp.]